MDTLLYLSINIFTAYNFTYITALHYQSIPSINFSFYNTH